MSLVSDLRQRQASIIYFDCVVAEALSAAVRRLHERRTAARIRLCFSDSATSCRLPPSPGFYRTPNECTSQS